MSGPLSLHDIAHLSRVVFDYGKVANDSTHLRTIVYYMLESEIVLEWEGESSQFTRHDSEGISLHLYSFRNDIEPNTWEVKFFLTFADLTPNWVNEPDYRNAMDEYEELAGARSQRIFGKNVEKLIVASLARPENVKNIVVCGDVNALTTHAATARMFITDQKEIEED